MATYVTLVNELLRRMNEVTLDTAGDGFDSVRNVQALAKDAINNSIRLIIQNGQEFPFLKVTGTGTIPALDPLIAAGTVKVDFPSDMGTVDWDSFFLTSTGTGNPMPGPLPVLSFTEWQTNYRATDEKGSRGVPERVYQTQGNQFGVSPINDNNTYFINYVYWSFPNDLVNFNDVSIIPDRFKHVVIDGAMMFMMRFRSNEQSAAMHQNNFEDGIKTMRRVLVDDTLFVRSTFIGGTKKSSFSNGI